MPAAAAADGREASRRPLKSALKPSRPPPPGAGACTPEEFPFPTGKRVRIRSLDNLVHVFSTSPDETPEATQPWTNRVLDFDSPDQQPQHQAGSRGGPGAERAPSPLQAIAARQRARAARRRARGPVVATLSTLAWMAASSALIFLNKGIMVDKKWPFPFALTALGQFVSAGAGMAAASMGLARVRPRHALGVSTLQLSVVAACFAASLFLGNVAYLGLSVAFINILKALTPVATLAVGLALGGSCVSLHEGAAVALIAAGTMMATVQEASTAHFSAAAFGAFAASIWFEALRVVLTERLLGGEKAGARLSAAEVLVHVGPLTGAMLALASGDLASMAPSLAIASTTSVLVNLFCYWAIAATSSTTFKVAGCLKNAAVIGLGVAMGDDVTARQLQGYVISVAGFGLYTWIRQRKR